MYLVSGKNVSSNPMENVSEEIKKFVLKHHREYGKEEIMKRFPDVDESKEEYKFETPSFKSKNWFKQVRKRQEKLKKRAKKPPTKAEVYPKPLRSRLYPFRTTPTPLWTRTTWSPTCSWKKSNL